MKITFFESEGWEKDYLKGKFGWKTKVEFIQEPISETNLSKALESEIISVFIYSKLTKEILDKLPKLKMISTRSTGFDHIDISECKKRGIVVTNVPTYGENTVAEHTFGLILSLSRKIHKAYEKTIKGDFKIDELRGFDLLGKTLGVVGTGHIGQRTIRIAKGFGMRILAYDAFPNKKLSLEEGFDYVEFDELISKSDIITFHVPLIPATTHMLSMKNIKKVKRGAIIINTARGGIIETECLTYGLEKGILSGVGLDVIEGEDIIKEEKELLTKDFSKENFKMLVCDHVLLKDSRVIYTPHIAFNSDEAVRRIMDSTQESINAFILNKPLNKIN